MAGRRLGGLEAEVMQFIWSQDRPVGVNDIVPALKGRRRAYTTVMTVVTRLCEKGLITRERRGLAFVYQPAASKEEMAAQALRDLLASTEDPQAVLARFVKDLEASPQLLKRLRKLVRGGQDE
jgi:predicted transcriptional regulator